MWYIPSSSRQENGVFRIIMQIRMTQSVCPTTMTGERAPKQPHTQDHRMKSQQPTLESLQLTPLQTFADSDTRLQCLIVSEFGCSHFIYICFKWQESEQGSFNISLKSQYISEEFMKRKVQIAYNPEIVASLYHSQSQTLLCVLRPMVIYSPICQAFHHKKHGFFNNIWWMNLKVVLALRRICVVSNIQVTYM